MIPSRISSVRLLSSLFTSSCSLSSRSRCLSNRLTLHRLFSSQSSSSSSPKSPSSVSDSRADLDKSLDELFLKSSSDPFSSSDGAIDLNDDGGLESLTKSAIQGAARPVNDYSDVLDPNNPPKLNFSHYRLLSRVLLAANEAKSDNSNIFDGSENTEDLNPESAREYYFNVEKLLLPMDYFTGSAVEKRVLRDILSSMDLLQAFDHLFSAGITLSDEQLGAYDAAFKLRYPTFSKGLTKDQQSRVIAEGDRRAAAEEERIVDMIEQRIRESRMKGYTRDVMEEQIRAVIPEHLSYLLFAQVRPPGTQIEDGKKMGELTTSTGRNVSYFDDYNPYQITDAQLDQCIGPLRKLILQRVMKSQQIRADVTDLKSVLHRIAEEEDNLKEKPMVQFKMHKIGNVFSCRFCKPDLSPNHKNYIQYTNVELLKQFINLRGMITSRRVNGNCRKHQAQIEEAIKRARTIALLNWSSDWTVPPEFVYGIEAVKAVKQAENDRAAQTQAVHSEDRQQLKEMRATNKRGDDYEDEVLL